MSYNPSNIILNIPFDEADGASTAYDYSEGRHDASLTNCHFVAGRIGNCIDFNGNGHADIENNSIIPLSDNFTLAAWIKPKSTDGWSGKKITLIVNYGDIHPTEVTYNVGEDWSFWTLVKSGSSLMVYTNGFIIDTLTLTGTPVGLALCQDYCNEYAVADIDEFRAFDVALTQEDINGLISNVSQLTYSIDGKDFKDWDIYVSSSDGLLDRPKLKKPLTMDWAEYHGEIVDLAHKRVEPRVITLKCWMKAAGKVDFANKINDFLDVFSKEGTQRLMVDIHPVKPLVYEVYNADGVSIEKRWHDDLMIGTFTLKLREPDPVKKVLRHQKVNEATKEVSITLTSAKAVVIYWGDGTYTNDIYGENINVKHNYADNGIYYVIVAGVIEDITSFTTNAIVVWNKL